MARGLNELDGVQMNLTGDVPRKPGAPKFAEETDLTAGAGLAESDEIEPAVIVVIDGGESESRVPNPSQANFTRSRRFAFNVAPQADAGGSDVGESQIHPSVFIRNRNATTPTAGGRFSLVKSIVGSARKLSFARIQVNRGALSAAGDNEIDGTIVVEIGGDQASSRSIDAQTRFRRDISVKVLLPLLRQRTL